MNDTALLKSYLDDPATADAWLRSLGVVDVKHAHAAMIHMAGAGVTLDLLAVIAGQLQQCLPRCADPDMALNNLDRFVGAARSPLALATLFERDPGTLPTLVQILSTSQHFGDLLVSDPEIFDLLRMTEGRPVARETLVGELVAEVEAIESDEAVVRALRRFKRRETMRIAYGDIVRRQPLRTVTAQISYMADALLEGALRAAGRTLGRQRGTPLRSNGQPARFTILGMGKLGGLELNYSSDIDLIFLYDEDGRTDGHRPIENAEFFDILARDITRLMTEATDLGVAWRVDLRLRPEGARGRVCPSLAQALSYYDLRGRTWERQAYIKARPVAGSLSFGREFLDQLAPWVYRRYLSRADISGIKALKRRIERRSHRAGLNTRDVKTGRGGIRDIEFVIQFLQLLNGADLPEIRTGNTLDAIAQLEKVGCLSDLERSILEGNYRFLRRIEHLLQIMFDLQTHALPNRRDERRKLALRMGYRDNDHGGALEQFESDFAERTGLNRRILDHLLNDAFRDDTATEAEADLVLDPDPGEQRIAEVLGRYPFRDVKQAHRNLLALSEEGSEFLSTRRCRHFLAAIAPSLLHAIAATPDPDSTLVNLGNVSASLGGKGVLWELFSFNQPSLRLYVELCAYSPYLCNILTSSPGMIDGLMDSLVLDKLPDRPFLEETLMELCRAAEDLDPILHAFKNDQQLRVGVRELLGKEDVRATTTALSHIAEVCLDQIVRREYARLAAKFGRPVVDTGRRQGKPCELIILAMGKFGGWEMNYHSDLDLVFLFEAEGNTDAPPGTATSSQHFFSELGQRIIKTASRLSPYGRLYEVDVRLRPTGRSGALATSLDEFARYFAEGNGQLWERQALCKARVVYGSGRAAKAAIRVVGHAAFDHRWRRGDVAEVRRMRHRLEETADEHDLKRGPGGIVDVEFLVQMLQLKHGRQLPEIRTPNTLDALDHLRRAGLVSDADAQLLDHAYRRLRGIEGRLSLMNATQRNRLPGDSTELSKLAHLLHYPGSDALLADFQRITRDTRRCFDRAFDAAGT
ncbi:MAG: bifunctional [glutamate--ammonia ligase]-adenylyl-L-tyrosine phosphorylase/[glutamate--ammonia-ligase] adenylyltransferase [Thermoguttaceae bacterium]|jgi:glutamate-ammonia-ligase adenylyltransferase|nr:bifunctional [glutamate--ammonia ligase]-adenylyl-L-tyrosine phosphorylase/[glutamate--ammonia-ligase] adenylyltransferase [Thermoguttaceae bacterium]